MSTPARQTSISARFGSDQVAAAIEHHAKLNRRAISILSTEFSEDAARVWTVTFADEAGIAKQVWIEDPRPIDVVKADIFHNGVRLGLLG